jgi:putative DNA primase/helicase
MNPQSQANPQQQGFTSSTQQQGNSSSPNSTTQAPQQPSPKLLSYTDTGNAKFFVSYYWSKKRYFRYCLQLKTWYVWNDKYWEEDRLGLVQRMAKELALRLKGVLSHGVSDDAELSRIARWARSTQSIRGLNAMIELAKSEPNVATLPEKLDPDPWLLNVGNGTLNLKNGQLQPFNRADLITKIIPIDYDVRATCPLWEKFLYEIMQGDKETIKYLQKAAGYSLTGTVKQQVMFILHGLGENGKSVFIIVLIALFGDYAKHTTSSILLQKTDADKPTDVARLKGARFVVAEETDQGRKLAEAAVKQLTGGDPITARGLYKEAIQFDPTFKLWLMTNYLPEITGTDHGIWRRLIVVPFDFTPVHRDLDLSEKLKKELPGILKWAVDGALLWQKEGLIPPGAIKAASQAYRVGMDVVGQFIDDRCVIDPNASTPVKDLYSSYKIWCLANGERALTANGFGRALTGKGFNEARTANTKLRTGIRLKTNP